MKDVRKYIFSVEVQNTSLFSVKVELENALMYEMIMRQGLKRANTTDFNINVNLYLKIIFIYIFINFEIINIQSVPP